MSLAKLKKTCLNEIHCSILFGIQYVIAIYAIIFLGDSFRLNVKIRYIGCIWTILTKVTTVVEGVLKT